MFTIKVVYRVLLLHKRKHIPDSIDVLEKLKTLRLLVGKTVYAPQFINLQLSTSIPGSPFISGDSRYTVLVCRTGVFCCWSWLDFRPHSQGPLKMVMTNISKPLPSDFGEIRILWIWYHLVGFQGHFLILRVMDAIHWHLCQCLWCIS